MDTTKRDVKEKLLRPASGYAALIIIIAVILVSLGMMIAGGIGVETRICLPCRLY